MVSLSELDGSQREVDTLKKQFNSNECIYCLLSFVLCASLFHSIVMKLCRGSFIIALLTSACVI